MKTLTAEEILEEEMIFGMRETLVKIMHRYAKSCVELDREDCKEKIKMGQYKRDSENTLYRHLISQSSMEYTIKIDKDLITNREIITP